MSTSLRNAPRCELRGRIIENLSRGRISKGEGEGPGAHGFAIARLEVRLGSLIGDTNFQNNLSFWQNGISRRRYLSYRQSDKLSRGGEQSNRLTPLAAQIELDDRQADAIVMTNGTPRTNGWRRRRMVHAALHLRGDGGALRSRRCASWPARR